MLTRQFATCRKKGRGCMQLSCQSLAIRWSSVLSATTMGSGGSVQRSASSMRTEIEKLRKRELDLKEELERQRALEEVRREASECKLKSDKYELADQLREVSASLKQQEEGWTKERGKTLKLTFSNVPLSMLNEGRYVDDSLNIKHFPMVTIAQCDIVGFSSLSSRLQPKQLIEVIDHLQVLIDETFIDKDIFIMERTSDGCIAASGMNDTVCVDGHDRQMSPVSMTDSSYGSEFDFDLEGSKLTTREKPQKDQDQLSLPDIEKPPSAVSYAATLATAVLKLMSSSSRVKLPAPENSQLQLRIALHSGPCSGGVVGLQTGAAGHSHIPHYKLFGPTLRYVSNLCHSGLALQIRVSKQCRDLLNQAGGFIFERSPDYMTWDCTQPIESYWLTGKEGLQLKLPPLDHAIPLADYDDLI